MSIMKLKNIAKLALVVTLASPLLAHAGVSIIDFDYGADGKKIENGDKIRNQYIEWGVTINSCRLNGVVGNNTDQVEGICKGGNANKKNQQVAFNTERSGTIDPDLEFQRQGLEYVSESGAKYTPLTEYSDYYNTMFGATSLASDLTNSPGNVLIIKESNQNACGANCNLDDSTNDEGAQPAGFFVFNFERPVNILSLDFFDIESAEANLSNPANVLYFHSATGDVSTSLVANTGNAGYERVAYNNMYNITRLVVNMPGSGSINNLVFSHVSAPATILFMLLGAGFVFGRRKA